MNRQALSAPRTARELQDRSSASVNTRLALLRASLQVSSTGELWQPHEDAIVLEKCRSGWRYAQIAPLLLGRTPEAVRGRFRALRLNADGIVRHGKPWSLQEKKSLVNMKVAQGLTIGVISKELGRSFRSTSSAWDLARKGLDADVIKSLRRHSFYSSLEDDILSKAREQRVPYEDIIHLLPGRSFSGLQNRASRLRDLQPDNKVQILSRSETNVLRRALEPVLDGKVPYEEVASKFSDFPPRKLRHVDYRMRRGGYKTALPPPPPDTTASD